MKRESRLISAMLAAGLATLFAGCAVRPGLESYTNALSLAGVMLLVGLATTIIAAAAWLFWSLNDGLPAQTETTWRKDLLKRWPTVKEIPFDVLVGALHFRNRHVRAEASIEVCRRLSTMAAETFLSYGPSTRSLLYRSLTVDDEDLAIAVLSMAGRSRDLTARSPVARFAARPVNRSEYSRIHHAIRVCVETLNAAEYSPEVILLRASDSQRKDALLRPAVGSRSEPPEQLLRVSEDGS